MPGEWEPHSATWLAWPWNEDTWPCQLEEVKETWVEMARVLSRGEEVRLLVHNEEAEIEAARRLSAAGAVMDRIAFIRIPTVDVWIRDYGPNFITRSVGESALAFNDWVFNAWGRKYVSYIQDDEVARAIARVFRFRVFEHSIILEGGSIDVNGRGTCLTTEQCLLNPNRNPHLTQRDIEQVLKDSLAVDRVVWLGEGILGDDTDGHVDDIARFVNPTTVVCALTGDRSDENFAPLRENYERLRAATDQDGKRLEVLPLPMPGPAIHEGMRLPASYANFYIANQAVLVPTYGDRNDSQALGILKELFTDREVVGLPCRAVVIGLGAIHCVTQQEPRPEYPG